MRLNVTYVHSRSKVKNRGRAPIAFLDELVEWGRHAPEELFAPSDRYDIYSSVVGKLGPWSDSARRRAAMLEVLRVLAGFESSWDWLEGVDVTNPDSNTPCTEEAGIFQCSGNSMRIDLSLRACFEQFGGTGTGNAACDQFRALTKQNHEFALEYCARLLRFTTRHHGPIKREQIHAWLSIDSMNELRALCEQID